MGGRIYDPTRLRQGRRPAITTTLRIFSIQGKIRKNQQPTLNNFLLLIILNKLYTFKLEHLHAVFKQGFRLNSE